MEENKKQVPPPGIHAVIGPGKKSPQEKQTQRNSGKSKDLLAAMLQAADEDKKPKKRPYLHFKEFGLVIPFWAIVSVEKDCEMVQRCGKYVWMYEIILNRGIESSPNMPFGEHKLTWDSMDVCNAKFDALIKTLVEHNYELNEI